MVNNFSLTDADQKAKAYSGLARYYAAGNDAWLAIHAQIEADLASAAFLLESYNLDVEQVLNEIAEKTNSTKIVLSDLQNTAFRSKEKAVLECLISKKIESIFVHSHAKIISLDCGENKYTILGSGNLAANARVEQYQIINSIEMFNFVSNCFDEMKYIQIKKRNKDLWHTIK